MMVDAKVECEVDSGEATGVSDIDGVGRRTVLHEDEKIDPGGISVLCNVEISTFELLTKLAVQTRLVGAGVVEVDIEDMVSREVAVPVALVGVTPAVLGSWPDVSWAVSLIDIVVDEPSIEDKVGRDVVVLVVLIDLTETVLVSCSVVTGTITLVGTGAVELDIVDKVSRGVVVPVVLIGAIETVMGSLLVVTGTITLVFSVVVWVSQFGVMLSENETNSVQPGNAGSVVVIKTPSGCCS